MGPECPSALRAEGHKLSQRCQAKGSVKTRPGEVRRCSPAPRDKVPFRRGLLGSGSCPSTELGGTGGEHPRVRKVRQPFPSAVLSSESAAF